MTGNGQAVFCQRPTLVMLTALFFMTAGPVAAVNLNPLSAVKGAVEAVVEDRSAEDIKTDLRIKAAIVGEVLDKMTGSVIDIGADVYEQDVMLTGAVNEEATKIRAGELAGNIKGVRQIYNEILVIAPLDRDKGAVQNFVDDTVIETKINALLLDAGGVSVTNFRYRSINGHVFLFGRALSEKEKQKAETIVQGIKNVKSVKNLAKVRPKR